MKPFRWNVTKREQLGTMIAGPDDECPIDDTFLENVRLAASRILALGDESDFAFIGRTPENFFDYLSGVFHGLDKTPDLHIVQFSLRWAGRKGLLAIPENKRNALFDYFTAERVDPKSIATGPRPLALVDFVVDGGTMENFVGLLKLQSERDGVDWNAVQRRLRIIGLRVRTHNSPNTWRWQQHQDWLHMIPDTVIKNVSMPGAFLFYLGDQQPKVTRAHSPEWWDRFDEEKRALTDGQRVAVGIAVRLFDLGRTAAERRKLAGLIARTHQMRQAATRSIVMTLRNAG